MTSLQRHKVLQGSTQEVGNRGHKNRGTPLVRSTQNTKHRQVMANRRTAVPLPPLGEPYSATDDSNILVAGPPCATYYAYNSHLAGDRGPHSDEQPFQTAMQRVTQLELINNQEIINIQQRRQMRQIERELQEVISNQTITRVDANLQPATTANSTRQILCTILATAVDMMIAFTMMLLSRQEG